MEQTELLTMLVTKEQHHQLALAKMESLSKEQLVEGLMLMRARDIFTLVRLLVSQVGKEKAKQLIEEVQYAAAYQRGKAAAEKAGYPTDVDGYIEANSSFMRKIPASIPSVVVERTKKRFVSRNIRCLPAEALLKVGAEDPETLEVVKYICPHDTAWAHGFNPKMKFERTKFLLDGDDCCEFVTEVE